MCTDCCFPGVAGRGIKEESPNGSPTPGLHSQTFFRKSSGPSWHDLQRDPRATGLDDGWETGWLASADASGGCWTVVGAGAAMMAAAAMSQGQGILPTDSPLIAAAKASGKLNKKELDALAAEEDAKLRKAEAIKRQEEVVAAEKARRAEEEARKAEDKKKWLETKQKEEADKRVQATQQKAMEDQKKRERGGTCTTTRFGTG